MKYLKKKPVRDLTGDQFLKLTIAAQDKLLDVTISDQIEGNTGPSYLEELKQLYQKVSCCKIHFVKKDKSPRIAFINGYPVHQNFRIVGVT